VLYYSGKCPSRIGEKKMTRSEKKTFVESFSGLIPQHECIIVVRHDGVGSELTSQIRQAARKENMSFRIVKNSLFKLSLPESAKGFSDRVKGPIGVFLAQDPVAASKAIVSFGKKKKNFSPIVGIVSGKVVDEKEIAVFSTLQSLEQTRATLLRTLSAPATSLLRTLKEPQASLVRLIAARSKSVMNKQ
jgi:large subunit ribosomal protein L10